MNERLFMLFTYLYCIINKIFSIIASVIADIKVFSLKLIELKNALKVFHIIAQPD